LPRARARRGRDRSGSVSRRAGPAPLYVAIGPSPREMFGAHGTERRGADTEGQQRKNLWI
jgi:hypothetical protein